MSEIVSKELAELLDMYLNDGYRKLLVVDEIGYLPFGRDEATLFFIFVAKR